MSIAPAAAAQLVTTIQPTSVSAGAPFLLAVKAEDAFGNLATGFSSSMIVALAANPGGGTLAGTTVVSAIGGNVIFTGLSINAASVGYTLQIIGGGLIATSGAFNVTPGAAAQLAITAQPPTGVLAGVPFGLAVQVEDSFGNLATNFNGSITAALAGNADGAVLGGATTTIAFQGIATFSGLIINTAGSGYTILLSRGSLNATTDALDVAPAAATHLVITAQPPSSVYAGSVFGMIVAAEDQYGNVATGYSSNITVALANNPGNNLTVEASSGLATFSNMTINAVGSGYTYQAISNGLTSASTTSIAVVAVPVPYLVFSGQVSGAVGVGQYFQLTVVVENAQGVPETSFAGRVNLELASNPGGATLGGNLSMPVSNGRVTFYGLTLNVPGSGYTIQASSSGFNSATTSPITVASPPATQLVVAAPPPASIAANAAFGLTIAVVDASGNLVTSYNGSVTVALVGKTGAVKLRGTLTATAVNGVATFAGLTLTKARKGNSLRFTANGLTATSTGAFTATPAAKVQKAISQPRRALTKRTKARR